MRWMIVVLMAGSGGVDLLGQASRPAAGDEGVRVAPLVRQGPGGTWELELVLENNSDRPFRYIPLGHREPIACLKLTLSRDGRPVPTLESDPRWALLAEHVKELKPGQALTRPVDVKEVWGDLKPGRYRLEGQFNRRKAESAEVGLSSLSLDGTLIHFEIAAEK